MFRKQEELNPVLMTESDYCALKPLTGTALKANELSLARELERAIIVHKDAFPAHAIRLNSQVTLVEQATGKSVRFTIVLPKHADSRLHKISALAPVAVAIIGFRKGELVQCRLPRGTKVFLIEEVVNQHVA